MRVRRLPQLRRDEMHVDVEGFRATMREAGAGDAVDAILDAFVAQLPERLAALETMLVRARRETT